MGTGVETQQQYQHQPYVSPAASAQRGTTEGIALVGLGVVLTLVAIVVAGL